MFLRNTLIASTTIVTALIGADLNQEAIALPLSSPDTLLVSQANSTSYIVEAVKVMDINRNGDTLWVRAMEGDNTHRPLYSVPVPILSRVQNGDTLYLLKSGSYVVDVAWSESELGIAQITAASAAARAEVQALYSGLAARSEVQTLSMPRAQVSPPTPMPRSQPAPQPVNVPVRGLW